MQHFLCALTILGNLALADDESGKSSAATRRTAQRELEPFNDWVGGWKGVGQPKRGSSKGAWTEEAEWAWKIGRTEAAIEVDIKGGKLLQGGTLLYDPESKRFRFIARLVGGGQRTYVGERGDEEKLILLGSETSGVEQHRMSIQIRHQDRMLMLLESRPNDSATFSRVAEVGYTRKGGSFAAAADAGPKCIVTGGRGSIEVKYEGKTYYVCCSGCKTAFLDDPAGIIAEAAERSKKEASQRKKN